MMRVVYYTESPFMDVSLGFMRAMSRLAELHVVLQVRPRRWPEGQLDLPPTSLPAGIMPAQAILERLPPGLRPFWQDVASINLVVHNQPSMLHPVNAWVSHQAARFMRRLAPDVIHLEGMPGRLVWALPELRGWPLVLTFHDPEPHTGYRSRKDTLARWLAVRRADQFILHNRAQKDRFCVRYHVPPERVSCTPLGPYDCFRAWADSPATDDGRTILFFGQIYAYKGLDVLYRAAPMICERVPGAHFVVAGRPAANYAMPVPPALPNGGRIQVISRFIHNAELARLFQEATVVVCPYTDATQSGVVLTAYAFGKPVVATRVGGLPEYIADGQTGVLVPPGSPVALAEALADTLLRLAAQPTLREHFARQIQARRDGDLSWDAIAAETLATYQRATPRQHTLRTPGWWPL